MEEEATRNYWRTYLLYGLQSHRDPLLDEFLPSLIYIKAVTILDDAFEMFITSRGLQVPSKYQDSLAGRIDCLSDIGILFDGSQCHRIRRRRNELAHETGARATWDELENDRNIMHEVLQALRFVADLPRLEFYSERSAMRGSTKPGYSLERDFKYGIKENGKVALEIKWSQYIE